MSEAREQFRVRIWRVFEGRQYTYPEVAQSLAAHRAAAEAVYAAALRDVLSAMRHRYDNVIDTDDLIRWAAARGIDLEDAP